MAFPTDASLVSNTPGEWATLSYVPAGARVAISVAGINGHVVELQALWGADQAGAWEAQQSWDAEPTEGHVFIAPRVCSLRIGPTSAGTGSVTARISYDWPIRR